MNDTTTEEIVIDRFQFYLDSGVNIQEATDDVILDVLNEGLTDDEIASVVQDILVPSIAIRFAESWETSRKKYEPGDYFNAFCKFGHIGEDLENAVANFINEGAQQDTDGDEDCFLDNDWNALSDEERQQRVKLFLKKLVTGSKDFSDNKPFTAISKVGPDGYGNDFSAGVKEFNRGANRYGHNKDDEDQEDDKGNRLKTATIPTTNESVAATEDQDKHFANAHRLSQTLRKHGYSYLKTVRATSTNHPTLPKVEVVPHHIWNNAAGHLVSAAEHDTKWSSKVSAHSGHSWQGIGSVALDKHLTNKARRYATQLEQKSLPHVPLLENLLNTSNVSRYVEWAKRNEFRSLDHPVTSNDARELRDGLKASWQLREEQEKKFGSTTPETYLDVNERRTRERNKKQ